MNHLVLDTGMIRRQLEAAIERFVVDVMALCERPRAPVDLADDPRPWDVPLRPANTNGSLLLDQFVPLLRPQAVEKLGPELAIAMLTFALVTDHTALWRRAQGKRPAHRGKGAGARRSAAPD